MQMRHSANRWRRRHCTVYMRIDRENVLRGQIVLPLNLNRTAAKRFNQWAWILPFVSPYCCRGKLRMHGVAAFQHAHLVCRYAFAYFGRRQSLRNWKRVDKPVERRRCAVFLHKSRRIQEVLAMNGAGNEEGGYRLKAQF